MPFKRFALLVSIIISLLSSPLMAEEKDGKKAADSDRDVLRISSWGGAYSEAQSIVLFKPFSQLKNIKIQLKTNGDVLSKLTKMHAKNKADWDVADVSTETAMEACDKGLIVKIPVSILRWEGEGSVEEDFLANSLLPCAIPSVAWSAQMAFDKRAFKKSYPSKPADFFNLRKYPGKRSLPKSARYSLEFALLGDGVSPDNIYSLLTTEEGQQRAFKKLDKIKEEIIWWNQGDQAIDNLSSQKAVMGLGFNGRLFSAIVGRGAPLGLIWNGQIYDIDYWVIPAHSKEQERALDFIAFATAPKQLAKKAEWFPYGPMRRSALSKIGKHSAAQIQMDDFIPTQTAHMKRALRLNISFWKQHGKDLREKFNKWLKGEEIFQKPSE